MKDLQKPVSFYKENTTVAAFSEYCTLHSHIFLYKAELLQVEDVPDQPPEWVEVAAVTRLQEDVPLFTPVGDQDQGPHRVYYKHVCR